ncbi:MAG: lipopolysaccharide export system permease protein [Planctomycetota bacterium]
MIIISRYLIREVSKPILIFFLALTFIFAAYSASEFLGKAAQGLIRIDTIAILVFLKSVIAMEVVLPIATFLTVVVVLSRLGATYEITAMAFCGYSRLRVHKALAIIFVVMAIIVGFLSTWARPRVYAETYRILQNAKLDINLNDVQEGVFLAPDDGKTVIFLEPQGDANPRKNKRDVFVFLERSDGKLVMRADRIQQVNDAETGAIEFVFKDLEIWSLDGGADSMTVATDEMSIPFDSGTNTSERKRRKATTTSELFHRTNPEDMAEFQWRLVRPFSTLVLGFLAVALSSFVPRRDRFTRLLLAVVVYIIYFNLQALAKTWVEQGIVPAIPGLFWVDGLIALVLLFLFVRSRIQQSRPA